MEQIAGIIGRKTGVIGVTDQGFAAKLTLAHNETEENDSMTLKYRVHEVARDLNVPKKEIIDLLDGYFGGEPPQTCYGPYRRRTQCDFEHYTQEKQVPNFDQYFADKEKSPILTEKAQEESAKSAPKAKAEAAKPASKTPEVKAEEPKPAPKAPEVKAEEPNRLRKLLKLRRKSPSQLRKLLKLRRKSPNRLRKLLKLRRKSPNQLRKLQHAI